MVRRPSFDSGGLPYAAVADCKLPMPYFDRETRPSFGPLAAVAICNVPKPFVCTKIYHQ